MPEKELLGVNGALGLSQKAMGELFGKYVNPGLKTLQSVVGFDKRFVRADGVSVYDEDGNRYLDFVGGYGCLPFGHSPQDILAALDEVKEVPNYLQVMTSPYQAALAHDLAQIAPDGLGSLFLKQRYRSRRIGPQTGPWRHGRRVFVYCSGAFHGKTLELTLGGRP